MKSKKAILTLVAIIALAAIIYGIVLYRDIFSGNTNFGQKEMYVNIPTNSNFEQVKEILTPVVKDMEKFESVAEKKSYPENIKAGHFLLRRGMNSNEIINALRRNIPIKLAFNNQERLEDLAGRIGSQIEADSTSLMKSFLDPEFLADKGFSANNVLSMFIPNSYEIYWNTDAESFRNKMADEYKKFWNAQRMAKAAALELTPLQVSVIASIVHKETVKPDERPRVAGVYLNRLSRGMKLEADPTVIYAVKKQANDWHRVIKRVLYQDLETDSPYNTYMYGGLPPGPIAMPDIGAIDAVLNPEKHNYLYFCASVTRFGYHEFAVTPAQHEANRRKYVAWINSQGNKR